MAETKEEAEAEMWRQKNQARKEKEAEYLHALAMAEAQQASTSGIAARPMPNGLSPEAQAAFLHGGGAASNWINNNASALQAQYAADLAKQKEREREQAALDHRMGEHENYDVGGSKVLAVPTQQENPPNWWDNIKENWNQFWQDQKEKSNFFYNAYGQDLVDPATLDEILDSPDIAAMKTYVATAINVQRVGANVNHIGPAQLSREELDTDYGIGFESIGNGEFRGYGLGLPGADPYDGEIAVLGMNNRIQQVLDKAEQLGEKNDITIDETDKFIMVAMAQNGPGFDLNDIQIVMNQTRFHTADGQIDWDAYFAEKQIEWDRKVEETKWWDIWQQRNNSKTDGADFDTKFVLEEFYAKATDLQAEGYYLPENLDTQAIENLIEGIPTTAEGQ